MVSILSCAAARADVFDHLEEVRMDHRLAARERQVRDLVVHQLFEHSEDLLAAQLVLERLAGAAFLDAMQAREIALVGDLPRDVERRAQVSGLGGAGVVAGCRRCGRSLSRRRSSSRPFCAQIGDEAPALRARLRRRHPRKRSFRIDTISRSSRTGRDLAHDCGRGGVERVDLLGARLEKDAAELLLTKLTYLASRMRKVQSKT